MAIVIKKTSNRIDKLGLLSKVVLAAGQHTVVYSGDKDVVNTLIDISICNSNVTNATVNVWIVNKDNLNPTLVDLVESNLIFSKDSVFIRTGLLIDSNEKLMILSDVSGVVVRVTGLEDRTP